MARYDESDLRITLDGDLAIDLENGDFELVHNSECTAQGVYCRVKSSDPEWFDERICANLEDLLGQPNTKETGEAGEELIRNALLEDDLISIDDLYIQAVPIDKYTLLFFVYFKSPNDINPIGFEVELNLSAGAVVRRMP